MIHTSVTLIVHKSCECRVYSTQVLYTQVLTSRDLDSIAFSLRLDPGLELEEFRRGFLFEFLKEFHGGFHREFQRVSNSGFQKEFHKDFDLGFRFSNRTVWFSHNSGFHLCGFLTTVVFLQRISRWPIITSNGGVVNQNDSFDEKRNRFLFHCGSTATQLVG